MSIGTLSIGTHSIGVGGFSAAAPSAGTLTPSLHVDVDVFPALTIFNGTYRLAPDFGVFSYVGQDAALVFTAALSAAAGAFSYTGQDTALNLKRRLLLDVGVFSYSGQILTLAATQAVETGRVAASAQCTTPEALDSRVPAGTVCGADLAPTDRIPLLDVCADSAPTFRVVPPAPPSEPELPPTCVDPTGWARVADMPVATAQNYGVVVGDYFYVFGGSITAGGAGVSDKVQRYNKLTNTWDLPTLIPVTGRREPCAGPLPNGKIFVAGGFDSSPQFRQDAYWYDPDTNTWETKNNLPWFWVDARMGVLPDGRMLISGGSLAATPVWNNTRVTTTYIYDPALDTYTLTGSLNVAKGNHLLVALNNGKLLSTSGVTNPNNVLSTTSEIYDPATGLWTVVAPIPAAANYSGICATPCGKVYVWGGAPEGSFSLPTEKVYSYDVATDVWTQIDSLPVVLGGVAFGQFADGRYITAGGWTTGGAMSAATYMTP